MTLNLKMKVFGVLLIGKGRGETLGEEEGDGKEEEGRADGWRRKRRRRS